MSLTGKSTRSRIVEAARCLFWPNGYGLTTVNQILDRAQANPGSFYHLFRTKENVLLTVLHNNTRLFVPTIVNPIFEKITDPIDRIFATSMSTAAISSIANSLAAVSSASSPSKFTIAKSTFTNASLITSTIGPPLSKSV